MDQLQACTNIFKSYGLSDQAAEELTSYNQNVFTHPSLDTIKALCSGTVDNTPEPHIETWKRYAQESQTDGVAAVLKRHLIQLQFPIQAGISETETYRAATRRGVWPSSEGSKLSDSSCMFQAPDQLNLMIHASIAGPIPVITAGCRADFNRLVQALTRRNEPVPIPLSMGSCIICGYNNWERIDRYRQRWKKQWCRDHANIPGEAEWNAEFKKLIADRTQYQDRFMLLSCDPYSHVTAAELGLTEAEWTEYSLVIRLEHECTHYFTLRFLNSMKNHLLDELIADYRGIVAAVGYYRADWFLRFMGLEAYPTYRQGGRLENYRGMPSLSDAAFQALQTLVKQAAENLERFDHRYRDTHVSDPNNLVVPLALSQLTLVDLASQVGVALINRAVDQILEVNHER